MPIDGVRLPLQDVTNGPELGSLTPQELAIIQEFLEQLNLEASGPSGTPRARRLPDRILHSRLRTNQAEYLVRAAGQPPEADYWITASALRNDDLVYEYLLRNPDRRHHCTRQSVYNRLVQDTGTKITQQIAQSASIPRDASVGRAVHELQRYGNGGGWVFGDVTAFHKLLQERQDAGRYQGSILGGGPVNLLRLEFAFLSARNDTGIQNAQLRGHMLADLRIVLEYVLQGRQFMLYADDIVFYEPSPEEIRILSQEFRGTLPGLGPGEPEPF